MTKKEKLLGISLFLMVVVVPFSAIAANLWGFVGTSQRILNIIIPLFMTIAVAVFVWGVVMYISAGGDADKEKTARGRIIYGLIGLFVLVAFWGLVTVVTNTFGISEGGAPFSTKIDLIF